MKGATTYLECRQLGKVLFVRKKCVIKRLRAQKPGPYWIKE